MSSPSRRIAIVLLVAILSTLVLPLLVSAGTVEGVAPPPVRPAPRASGLYQVRCWQYGRLLFEERDVQLPSDIAAGVKLRGSDRNRLLVYVADTGNATCLIRGTPARP
jgi:hypothetical protein